MITKIILFSFLFFNFFMSGLALSTEVRRLDVDVSYSGAAEYYLLFKNDFQYPVCWIYPHDVQGECIVELDDTPMAFFLTATDRNGVESPRSAPYILYPPLASFTSSEVNCILNWLEDNYPSEISPSRPTFEWVSPYHFRHYIWTNSFLGYSFEDDHLYFFGATGGLRDLGLATTWSSKAGCR